MPHRSFRTAAAQHGVVLIISLIMLVVISLLATLSIRNAASSENVSGNVRTTMLASQAAEIALRYCEDATVQTVTGVVTLPSIPVLLDAVDPPRWKQSVSTTWDVTPTSAFTIPDAYVNQAGSVTFKRVPECMVERMPVVTSAGTVSFTTTYVITVRGFGPEVAAANAARSRPVGSEVWLQSTIELQ